MTGNPKSRTFVSICINQGTTDRALTNAIIFFLLALPPMTLTLGKGFDIFTEKPVGVNADNGKTRQGNSDSSSQE